MRDNPDENFFVFDDRQCAMCAAREKHMRVLDARDQEFIKAAGEGGPSPSAKRPNDGVHVVMRPATNDEVDKAKKRRLTGTASRARTTPTTPATTGKRPGRAGGKRRD